MFGRRKKQEQRQEIANEAMMRGGKVRDGLLGRKYKIKQNGKRTELVSKRSIVHPFKKRYKLTNHGWRKKWL